MKREIKPVLRSRGTSELTIGLIGSSVVRWRAILEVPGGVELQNHVQRGRVTARGPWYSAL